MSKNLVDIDFDSDFDDLSSSSDFLVRILNENEKSILPHYIYKGVSDTGRKLDVKCWIVDNDKFSELYNKLIQGNMEEDIVVTLLSSNGSKNISIKYESVTLSDFYFDDLDHDNSDPALLQLRYRFEDKEFVVE